MKSFCTVVNVLPLLFVSPPFSFIDDTKVRHISTSAKNRNRNLLSSYQGGIGAENTHKLHIAPKMGFLAKKSPFEIGCSGGFVEKIAEEKNIFFLKFFEKKFSEAFFRTKTAGQRVWPAVIFVR